ncbi:MAG TPA: hypothetical protein VMV82_02650 [Candidatus Dormibacteraeota bacterium]|nr:hypothetical protein [Candidatus Dormibacteraeota bacterium]
MIVIATLLAMLLAPLTVAQATPVPLTVPPSVAPLPPVADTLNSGPCLDSPRSVPHVLQDPVVREMQVVRIQRVISTGTMTRDNVIGFLYTTDDGTTWLGQRSADYMSAANARQINHVLASTRLSPIEPDAFPPTMRYGVPVRAERFFRVQIPERAMGPLRIRLDACVAWPQGRPLPDPAF